MYKHSITIIHKYTLVMKYNKSSTTLQPSMWTSFIQKLGSLCSFNTPQSPQMPFLIQSHCCGSMYKTGFCGCWQHSSFTSQYANPAMAEKQEYNYFKRQNTGNANHTVTSSCRSTLISIKPRPLCRFGQKLHRNRQKLGKLLGYIKGRFSLNCRQALT